MKAIDNTIRMQLRSVGQLRSPDAAGREPASGYCLASSTTNEQP